jgi:aminopeptidase N
MDIYIRPADTTKARLSFVNLKHMMSIYENRFGPYRWERVGYVITSLGAMEHATNIALPAHTVTGSTSNEWLYAHELSHHWFGNLVTCASAGDMWLNEGWAVFCEQVFMEGMYGWDAYKSYSRENHESILSKLHTSAGDGSYMAVFGIPHQYTYGKTVYDKGASMAHSLRGYLGDSLFFPAVTAYLDSFRFQAASTHQFRDFLSSYTSQNLTPWFDAWIFSPGFIHYGIDSVTILPQGNNFTVSVWVKQKLKGPSQYCNHNRIEINFLDAQWNMHSRIMEFSGIKGDQSFLLPFNPLAIMLNAEEKTLDASTSQYKKVKQTGLIDFTTEKFKLDVTQAADSAFVRVIHNWVAPDPLKSFVPRLILSENRYWTIEGHFPSGFTAKGRFSYGKNNYLDPLLLADNKDSLVILYRKDATEEWQGINFTKTGTAIIGFMVVDNLKQGQYTLAVWDDNPLGVQNRINDKKHGQLEVFPNPASEVLSFHAPKDAGYFRISDTAGIIRQSGVLSEQSEEQTIHLSTLAAGTYFIHLYSDKGKRIAGSTFIKTDN